MDLDGSNVTQWWCKTSSLFGSKFEVSFFFDILAVRVFFFTCSKDMCVVTCSFLVFHDLAHRFECFCGRGMRGRGASRQTSCSFQSGVLLCCLSLVCLDALPHDALRLKTHQKPKKQHVELRRCSVYLPT